MITFCAYFLIFCAYLFSGWRSYISVSFNVNQATNATTRDCCTMIIQNMFGDICNENSISMKIKAIYSAVKNVIRIKNLICLRFTSESTFMADVDEDIFDDQCLLTAYFMRTNIPHRSWHLIGRTTLGQRKQYTLAQRWFIVIWPTCPTLPQRPTMFQRASCRWANVIY